jgi:hypothetical protein
MSSFLSNPNRPHEGTSCQPQKTPSAIAATTLQRTPLLIILFIRSLLFFFTVSQLRYVALIPFFRQRKNTLFTGC